jgi:hypothetical protein
MPWQGSERFDYDLDSVLIFAPMKSGVFATFAREQWVYLGESGNICGQLLDHLHGDNACIARCSPTHFAYELTAPATRRARHQELVQEFQPVCTAG